MSASEQSHRPTPSPQDRSHVGGLVIGTLTGYLVGAAVRLKVFDRIGDEECHSDAVAAACGTHPQATLRLLRALASQELLTETAPGTFRTTPAGSMLRTDTPDSVTALVDLFIRPTMLRAWERLDDSIRSGGPTFPDIFGHEFFDHLKEHPDQSRTFNTAMRQATAQVAELLPKAHDFSGYTTVADVGGGEGTLLAAVLTAHPELRGIVYDSPEGLAATDELMERLGLADRCTAVPGDFFASVPEGADVHLLKSILHDWSDERCEVILGHCRRALPAHGKVLIVEPVLPETVTPAGPAGNPYLTDLNMLVNLGGRERTRADFEELCARSGLRITSLTPLAEGSTPFWLIEAVPDQE